MSTCYQLASFIIYFIAVNFCFNSNNAVPTNHRRRNHDDNQPDTRETEPDQSSSNMEGILDAVQNNDLNPNRELLNAYLTERAANRGESVGGQGRLPEQHNDFHGSSQYGYLDEYLGNTSDKNREFLSKLREYQRAECEFTSNDWNAANGSSVGEGKRERQWVPDHEKHEEIGYAARKNILTSAEERIAQMGSNRDHLFHNLEESPNEKSAELRKSTAEYEDNHSFHSDSKNLTRAQLIEKLNELEHLKRGIAEKRSNYRQRFQALDENLRRDEEQLNHAYNNILKKLYIHDR